MELLFFVSLILFLLAVGIYYYKGIINLKLCKILFCLGIFISIFFYTIYGVAQYFTGEGITGAVVYYFNFGLSGAGFYEYTVLILTSILSIVIGIIFSLRILFSKKSQPENKKIYTYLIVFLMSLSMILNPVTAFILDTFFDYKEGFEDDSEFYEYYKTPEIKQIGEAKNFVFIYLEGFERTYYDEKIFPGLIKYLREFESKSISFTNIIQDVNSHHTMGGLIASQCGFPLFSPSHGITMSGMDVYLPLAVCLGDLLDKEGYYLSYYGGANLEFAGKGNFLLTHKFDEVKGREELVQYLDDRNYVSGWGLYDDSLFNIAYDRFVELTQTEDKFGLFLLTLDTHHPDGIPSKSCDNIVYNGNSNPMLDAVACTDYLVSNFIRKIRDSDYGDDTIIIVVSDHLAMRNSATDLLEKENRKNLFLINLPESIENHTINHLGLTLDIGSTILPYIGYEGDIGMSRNLNNINYSKSRVINILGDYNKFKPYILGFWNFPKIKNYLQINVDKGYVQIDDREFLIPILIEFNDQLETKLKFEFNIPSNKGLNYYFSEINEDEYFILIEECRKINALLGTSIEFNGYCLLTKNNGQYNFMKLISNVKFSTSHIRELVGLPSVVLYDNNFIVKRIAHAGGGIDGKVYTNSFEAMNKNMKKGFTYFEIDLDFTQDGHLICLHDWDVNFEKIFGFVPEKILKLEEFKKLVREESKYHICTFAELVDWMEENPDSIIVTDVKTDNIKALEIISETVPDFEKRIIPQIYKSENFDAVKEMGYEQVIWTLYRYAYSDNEVLENVKNFNGSFAITMPRKRAQSSLPIQLSSMNIPSYAHTVNSKREKNELIKKYGINEVYTDFLGP